MLCSLNGLRSVKKRLLILSRRFLFPPPPSFFQGTSWPLWSHDETLEKLSAICNSRQAESGQQTERTQVSVTVCQ